MIMSTLRSAAGAHSGGCFGGVFCILVAVALSLPDSVARGQGGVMQVAAAGLYTCAVLTDGRVKCWGNNDEGQLGNGTNVSSTTAVEVIGLPDPIKAVATGTFHACALSVGGGVKCWGKNTSGQLGDGTTSGRSTAVDVVGLSSGVTAIAAGYFQTCALTEGGAMLCWGGNLLGELGDGTFTERRTPVQVSGLASGVVGIATGGLNTAAIATGGVAKYWGFIGRTKHCFDSCQDFPSANCGTSCVYLPEYQKVPNDAPSLPPGVTAVAVKEAAVYPANLCALTADGRVMCWGVNLRSRLQKKSTDFRRV